MTLDSSPDVDDPTAETSTDTTADPTAETSTDTTADPTDGLASFERRPLLKALGAGAGLSLGSGLATAERAKSSVRQGEPRIHPLYGYSAADAAQIPDSMQVDHEVELHLVLPPEESTDHAPLYAHFEPSGLQVETGDVVQFTYESPDHTVTAYHPGHGYQRRVPEGVPPFSSPIVNVNGAWLYRFEQPGLYDVFCAAHHVFGMAGRFVVGDLPPDAVPGYEDTFEGSEDPPLLAPWSPEALEHELNGFSEQNQNAEWPYLTPVAILDSDALDPTRIQDDGSVSFRAVREELGYPDPEDGH